MEFPTAFQDFLQDIRPTKAQRDDYKDGHKRLRERLQADATLKPIIVAIFIQGSYRRATAIKPSEGLRSDVDLVVVTNLDPQEVTPDAALRRFRPFLNRHYEGKWRTNERSLGISMSKVDLDLVVTSAPANVELLRNETGDEDVSESAQPSLAEAHAWKDEPLHIPDRQWKRWDDTHPLVQLAETRAKNGRCNGHFVNVVKAIKWWKRHVDLPKHPKSYPLERLIFEHCPDYVSSVAEGLTRTLEALGSFYEHRGVPYLGNPGVPSQNVMARVPEDHFKAFIEHARGAGRLARRALDSQDEATSASLWRELLGPAFPSPPGGASGTRGGFTPRDDVSSPQGGRFA